MHTHVRNTGGGAKSTEEDLLGYHCSQHMDRKLPIINTDPNHICTYTRLRSVGGGGD